jgi:aspirochlorine biosynthesis cytochrome P450 monooxygenase
MTYVQKHTGTPTGMSIEELQETCNALILGGSETTASAISGAIYYLLQNPGKMDKLTKEIRSSFQKETEIDFVSTNRLTYQAAVLEESLRIFPPRKRPSRNYL